MWERKPNEPSLTAAVCLYRVDSWRSAHSRLRWSAYHTSATCIVWDKAYPRYYEDVAHSPSVRRCSRHSCYVDQANAAYFLHCYVQNPWCFGHGRPASNDSAEQSDSAKSAPLNKVTQQSNFQSLATFSVFATGFWSEEKISKENENVEKNQKQDVNERAKKKTKNKKWNEKNNDFLFN